MKIIIAIIALITIISAEISTDKTCVDTSYEAMCHEKYQDKSTCVSNRLGKFCYDKDHKNPKACINVGNGDYCHLVEELESIPMNKAEQDLTDCEHNKLGKVCHSLNEDQKKVECFHDIYTLVSFCKTEGEKSCIYTKEGSTCHFLIEEVQQVEQNLQTIKEEQIIDTDEEFNIWKQIQEVASQPELLFEEDSIFKLEQNLQLINDEKTLDTDEDFNIWKQIQEAIAQPELLFESDLMTKDQDLEKNVVKDRENIAYDRKVVFKEKAKKQTIQQKDNDIIGKTCIQLDWGSICHDDEAVEFDEDDYEEEMFSYVSTQQAKLCSLKHKKKGVLFKICFLDETEHIKDPASKCKYLDPTAGPPAKFLMTDAEKNMNNCIRSIYGSYCQENEENKFLNENSQKNNHKTCLHTNQGSICNSDKNKKTCIHTYLGTSCNDSDKEKDEEKAEEKDRRDHFEQDFSHQNGSKGEVHQTVDKVGSIIQGAFHHVVKDVTGGISDFQCIATSHGNACQYKDEHEGKCVSNHFGQICAHENEDPVACIKTKKGNLCVQAEDLTNIPLTDSEKSLKSCIKTKYGAVCKGDPKTCYHTKIGSICHGIKDQETCIHTLKGSLCNKEDDIQWSKWGQRLKNFDGKNFPGAEKHEPVCLHTKLGRICKKVDEDLKTCISTKFGHICHNKVGNVVNTCINTKFASICHEGNDFKQTETDEMSLNLHMNDDCVETEIGNICVEKEQDLESKILKDARKICFIADYGKICRSNHDQKTCVITKEGKICHGDEEIGDDKQKEHIRKPQLDFKENYKLSEKFKQDLGQKDERPQFDHSEYKNNLSNDYLLGKFEESEYECRVNNKNCPGLEDFIQTFEGNEQLKIVQEFIRAFKESQELQDILEEAEFEEEMTTCIKIFKGTALVSIC